MRLSAAVLVAGCLASAIACAQSADCPKSNGALKLPAGFCATVFAENIGHARHMVVAANGVLYVNTWSGRYFGNSTPHAGGFLVALEDTTGAGTANVIQRFGETLQTGGAGGTGIGIYKEFLYAESNDKIVKYPLSPTVVVPTAPAVTVVSGLPLGGDHPMHPFAIDADGSLFVDSGTATNACQEKNRAALSPGIDPCVEQETRGGIWRFDANLTDQVFSAAQRYATGIRNGEGFALDAAGKHLYVTQHGRDQLHNNWPALYKADEEATLPSEELVLLKKGADYGWPKCYYDPAQKKLVLAPEYGGDGGKKVGVCGGKMGPAAAFPAHWAPNGATFYDDGAFPARYRNGVFIAFHGSWDRAPYTQQGYNVVFQPMSGGRASGRCEIFADGFAGSMRSPGKAVHRPTSLAVGPDGALYVSDDVLGRIYKIVYLGGTANAGGQVTPCPELAAAAGPVASFQDKPPVGADPAEALPVPTGYTGTMVALGNRIYHGEEGGAACTGCHGADGAGTPLGPSLADSTWLWSDGSVDGIAATITAGVAQPKQYRAAMPALGGAQLSPDQVSALSAYVWGLSRHTGASAVAAAGEVSIPGDKIYPESVTSSAADGRMFIGSIGKRTIYVVKPGGRSADAWIGPESDPALTVFGVFANDKTNTLWACLSPLPGPHPGPPLSAVLRSFDLQTGAPTGAYPFPTEGSFCNDIAVGPDGTTYATDTSNMLVVRLKAGASALEVWAGTDAAFGPKGAVLDGIAVIGSRVFVNAFVTGKLFNVPVGADGKAGKITEVKLNRPLEGPDGMRAYRTNELLLIEARGPGRLSRLTFSGDAEVPPQMVTVREGFPQGPVSVTVVGPTGYVLEGQLAALMRHGVPVADAPPFHATPVALAESYTGVSARP